MRFFSRKLMRVKASRIRIQLTASPQHSLAHPKTQASSFFCLHALFLTHQLFIQFFSPPFPAKSAIWHTILSLHQAAGCASTKFANCLQLSHTPPQQKRDEFSKSPIFIARKSLLARRKASSSFFSVKIPPRGGINLALFRTAPGAIWIIHGRLSKYDLVRGSASCFFFYSLFTGTHGCWWCPFRWRWDSLRGGKLQSMAGKKVLKECRFKFLIR